MIIYQALSEIGPRLTGTEANDRAADLLAGAFAAHGLEVERRPFHFTGWQLQAPAQLSILSPTPRAVPCATMIRSAAGHATGRLLPRGKRPVIGVFEWESYDVVDGSGRTLAIIIQRDEPLAIPQCLDDFSAVPMVVVGSNWLRTIGAS